MLVRYFMSSSVFTVGPDLTCEEALRQLRQRAFRRAPVVENSRLVGVVTERDLIRRLPGTPAQASTRFGEEGLDSPVSRVMTRPPITVRSTDSLETTALLMRRKKIGGVPVVDHDCLMGIITESDVFRALCVILAFDEGCRVLIEEDAGPERGVTDYVQRASQNACRVRSLLRHPRPEGGWMVYVNVVGGSIDGFVDDVCGPARRIISVEHEED